MLQGIFNDLYYDFPKNKNYFLLYFRISLLNSFLSNLLLNYEKTHPNPQTLLSPPSPCNFHLVSLLFPRATPSLLYFLLLSVINGPF